MALALALCLPAAAQSPLCTIFPFSGDNGLTGVVLFDLNVNTAVLVNRFDCNLSATVGTSVSLRLHTRPGSYIGNELNPSAWTLAATDTGGATSAGTDNVTTFMLNPPLQLNPGQYGIGFEVVGGSHRYTGISGTTPLVFSNNEMTLTTGASVGAGFGGTTINSIRTWNGCIHYLPASGLYANFTASLTLGRPPLAVSFSDRSYSSDPTGVLTWAWDFDGNGTTDSTLQNPSHVYTTAGSYTVSLTVTDATHGSVTQTKPGYIVIDPNAPPIIGSFVTSGAGCPNRGNTIYEVLPAGAWDVGNSAVMFSPAGNTYVAVPGGSLLPIGPNAIDLLLAASEVSTPLPLGFTFPYVDENGPASTIAIQVLSNGYVSLEPGAITDTRCCNADVASFLADGPSFALLGTDLNPTQSGGRVVYEAMTVGASSVVAITWDQVQENSNLGPNTFQAQLWDTGDFVMVWGQINPGSDTALVGWSPGGGQIPGGEIDFTTDLPYTPTAPFGFPVTLSASVPPMIGQTFRIDVTNVPPTVAAGALMLGTGPLDIDLELIGAPADCRLLTNVAIASVPVLAAAPGFSIPLTIDFNPSTIGLAFETQVGLIDLTLPQPVKVLMSNRGTMTLGDVADVRAAATGGDSGLGNPANQGYFSVQNLSGNTLDIIGVEFDFLTSSVATLSADYFDPDNLPAALGQFDHGNGACTPGNSYYGTDVTTGLVYGAPGQLPSACDPAGFTGWIGSNPSTTAGTFKTVYFAFTDFQPGERFAFDCDTDTVPGNNGGGHAGLVVTITFSDMSTVSGELEFARSDLAEVFF